MSRFILGLVRNAWYEPLRAKQQTVICTNNACNRFLLIHVYLEDMVMWKFSMTKNLIEFVLALANDPLWISCGLDIVVHNKPFFS